MTRYALTIAVAIGTCFLGAVPTAQAQRADRDSQIVTVALRPSATIDSTIVDLDQIADIKGGTALLRRKIALLDVVEMKAGIKQLTVSLDQVKFRLLVAGIDPASFQLIGSKYVQLTENTEPCSLRQILAAADTALRNTYSVSSANVSFSLLGGTAAPWLDLQPGDMVRLEGKVNEPAPTGGLVRVNVSIFVNRQLREVVPVRFEVRNNAQPTPNMLDASLTRASLTTPAPAQKDLRTVLIKTRDPVKIVAPIGNARIEAGGEALQEGRAGDLIRVRNVESNRTVHGRVQDDGSVLVDY